MVSTESLTFGASYLTKLYKESAPSIGIGSFFFSESFARVTVMMSVSATMLSKLSGFCVLMMLDPSYSETLQLSLCLFRWSPSLPAPSPQFPYPTHTHTTA